MSKQKELEKKSERLMKLKKLAIFCDRIRDDELRWDAGEIVEELIKEETDKFLEEEGEGK